MGLKGKIEAVIYAAEEPVTLDQISLLVKPAVLQELAEEQARTAAAAEAETAAQESAANESQPEGTVELSPEAELVAESSEDRGQQHSTAHDAPVAAAEQPDATDQPVSDSEPVASTPSTEVDASVPPAQEESGGSNAPAEPSTVDQPASEPLSEAAENAAPTVAPKRKPKNEIPPEVKARVREIIEELIADYSSSDRGMEIRRVAGGFRMATKPEHHDVVKAFAKSLKPPLRLSLPALETLAVVAYKQPVTAPEVSEIRGVDSQGVIATLLDRKLITTAGRKAVIGRPILYKTTKEFLLRFGLKDVSELPSMEEFEKLAQDAGQVDMFEAEDAPAGQSTLHDVESEPESEVPGEGDAPVSADADIEGPMDRNGDYSSGADTSESAIHAQVEDEEQVEAGGSEVPSDLDRDVPGDYSSGTDTAESVVQAQVKEQGPETPAGSPLRKDP